MRFSGENFPKFVEDKDEAKILNLPFLEFSDNSETDSAYSAVCGIQREAKKILNIYY